MSTTREVTDLRNEVLSSDIHLVFAAQDSFWSRAQLQKQTAAEEPDVERTFGTTDCGSTASVAHETFASLDCQHQANTRLQRQSSQLKKSSLNAAWDQALPDTWHVTTDQEQHKKCMHMRSGLQKNGSVSRQNTIGTESATWTTEKPAWKHTDKQSGKHFRDAMNQLH